LLARALPLSALLLLSVPLLAGCSTTGIAFADKPTPALSDSAPSARLATASLAGPSEETIKTVAPPAPAEALGYATDAGAPSPSLDALVVKYAQLYGVPESLVRRVIVRESKYNPRAHNGPYLGLMQIRHDTAHSMGYQGAAAGLLDAETNLKYAVKYLRGAYLCADGDQDRAVRLYAGGYYYVAKHKGLLREVGLAG
jgi:soluble lytic murein transglycosylase-like protein